MEEDRGISTRMNNNNVAPDIDLSLSIVLVRLEGNDHEKKMRFAS